MKRRLLFVVPEMRAAVTGGNLYNLGLTGALREAGAEVRVVDREAAPDRGSGLCFVDSLYLHDLPRLKQAMPEATIVLLAHYLPSLVERGEVPAELSPVERAALGGADGFLVPSDFMARTFALLAPGRRVIVIAPAVDLQPAPASAIPDGVLRAVVVANLVPGKGVLALLDALAPQVRQGARLELTIIGSFDHEPVYASECRARVAADGLLAGAVRFTGALGNAETLSRVAASELLISASRMESFGLALAEARALGLPIVALAGGNAAALVEERAGGRLLPSLDAVAAECALLAREPGELSRRRGAAQAARLPRRSWADAAAELLAALDAV